MTRSIDDIRDKQKKKVAIIYFDGCNLGGLFVHYKATVHFVVKIRDYVVVFLRVSTHVMSPDLNHG
jgi:hypothetical protein